MDIIGIIVFWVCYGAVAYLWFRAFLKGSAAVYAEKIRDFHLNYGFIWAKGIIKIICVPLVVKIYLTLFLLLMTLAAIMLTITLVQRGS